MPAALPAPPFEDAINKQCGEDASIYFGLELIAADHHEIMKNRENADQVYQPVQLFPGLAQPLHHFVGGGQCKRQEKRKIEHANRYEVALYYIVESRYKYQLCLPLLSSRGIDTISQATASRPHV